MRVVIDGQILTGQGGVGEYTIGLIQALLQKNKHEYLVLTNELTRSRLKHLLNNDNQVKTDDSPVAISWLAYRLPKLLRRMNPDIYHGPAFLLPLHKHCPCIATVHDMIYRLYPKTMTWKRRLFWKVMMPNTWKKSDYIFADSENTKIDIVRLTKVKNDNIAVVPAGLNPIYTNQATKRVKQLVQAKYHLPDNYFICVGTLEPRKNLLLVIEAFQLYRHTGGKSKLVVVGPAGWLDTPIFKSVKEHKLENEVVFTGYIPFEDLPIIYQSAQALLFPSYYEGFGLPLLEGMASRIPVITAKNSSLIEVGGDAVCFVEPLQAEVMAKLMVNITEDKLLREQCISRGLNQIQKYSWERIADHVAELYSNYYTKHQIEQTKL